MTLFAGTLGALAGAALMRISANDLVRLISGGAMSVVVITATLLLTMPGFGKLNLDKIILIRR